MEWHTMVEDMTEYYMQAEAATAQTDDAWDPIHYFITGPEVALMHVPMPAIKPDPPKPARKPARKRRSSRKKTKVSRPRGHPVDCGCPRCTRFRDASFEELIEYNLDFLDGKHNRTFYHCAPVMDETKPFLPKLKKLHGHGLFTFSSQPPALTEEESESDVCGFCGEDVEDSSDVCGCCGDDDIIKGPLVIKTKQISYVDFIMEDSPKGRKLIEFLKASAILFKVIGKDGLVDTNVPEDGIWLTKQKIKPVDGSWGDWNHVTSMKNSDHSNTLRWEGYNNAFDQSLQFEVAMEAGRVEDMLLGFFQAVVAAK